MNYEEIENLRQQVQQLTQAMSLETDNFNALVVQCQEVYQHLADRAEITNKYGDFFVNLYRQISEEQENAKDRPLDQGRIVFEMIDTMETIQDNVLEERQRIADSGIEEKERQLNELQREIDKKEAYLQGLNDAIEKAVHVKTPSLSPIPRRNLPEETRVSKILEEHPPIRKNTPAGSTPKEQGVSPQKQAQNTPPPSNRREVNSVAGPSAFKHEQTNKQPEAIPLQTAGHPEQIAAPPMETVVVEGWTIPKYPESGHLYLCASNGQTPLDITSSRLPDIRRNHLIRFGQNFAKTGRPQFRLLRDAQGFLIGEQQNITNRLNDKLLQGEMRISHNDVLTMTDLEGKQLKVRFILG